MIIGLTGSMGAGKGEVVKILERFGFKYITLSQMVREEARKLGVEEEREKLMIVGNNMRSKEGAGVLAKRALQKINLESSILNLQSLWVVDGIRNPAEIDALREGKEVYIVGLHADHNVLIERILKRGRESDPKTHEEIHHRIEREWGKGEGEEGQQMEKCLQKADTVIENEGTLEELDSKIMSYYNAIIE